MAKLILPEALQRFVDNKATLICDVTTLNDLPAYIEAHHKSLYDVIFKNGELHGFVNLYVKGELVIDIKQPISLSDNDEIELLTSVSGG